MAVSAFYIHRRAIDQVLDRLIALRRRRSLANPSDVDDEEEEEGDVAGDGLRVSRSVPNVEVAGESLSGGERDGSRSCDDRIDFIPSGLHSLQTARGDGQDLPKNSMCSKFQVGSYSKLVTPRSSGGYAIGSARNSDDEQSEIANEEDAGFDYEDVDSSASYLNSSDGNLNIQSVYAPTFKAENSVLDQKVREVWAPNESKGAAIQNGGAGATAMGLVANELKDLSLRPIESVYKEDEEVWKMIRECLKLREKYVFRETIAPWVKVTEEESREFLKNRDPLHFVPVEKSTHHFKMEDGVVRVYASENDSNELFPVASSTAFFTDMHHLLKVMSIGDVRSTCHLRLRFLEEKFRLHLLVNADREFLAQKSAPHRDFYNIRKVDTHVHHSACMNQKHLLRFIKSKLRKEPDEVVIFRDGVYLTLKEVFESLQLTGYDLNVDLLDVHADKSTFHRFDKFNLKYNPCGQSRLREIFLKQDNLIQGRFLAEVTKEVLSDLEVSKYQLAEYRVSIYGRKQSEWDQLASWYVNNSLYSENAVWLIQLPRLYNVYKGMGTVTSFQNILDNVFIPLFEVTIDPNSRPHLHLFLMQVVGFDLVDDESKPERRPTKHMPKPAEWTNEFNPAYSYYVYYCYANLYTLNKLRESKGMSTIRLRPHCGEAGDIDHLAAAFLLCHNISHGINLRKSPVLQYLYYLAQIGLAMSPLSNNSLFLDYHRNPLPMFFQRGLNVSLSSDDPLQIHLTKEPLVEEYSVAAKVWKLTSCDLCEIARNSVYQSGFSHADKLHWLGGKYFKTGPEGNDIHKTNVPDLRISFRHETWKEEMQYAYSGKAMFPKEIEF